MKKQIVLFTALLGILIGGLAQANDRDDAPEFRKRPSRTQWSEVYGYSTNAPVRVETDPEAKHFEMKRLKDRVSRIEDRQDSMEARQDRQESRLDRVENKVERIESRLYWGYYPGYAICQFARLNNNAELMASPYYSSSNSRGTLYAGYTTLQIMSPSLTRWVNYPSTHAVYVRVVSSYAGGLTGSYGYVDLQHIPALACGFGISE